MERRKQSDCTKSSKTAYSRSCRLCLEKIKYSAEKIHLDDELKRKLHFCTRIILSDSEYLPNVICLSCKRLLSKSYNFITKCISNEELLLSQLTKDEDCQIKDEDLKNEDDLPLDFLSTLKTENEEDNNYYVDETFYNDEEAQELKNDLLAVKVEKRKRRKYRKREKKEPTFHYCAVCGQKCVSPSALRVHMYSHNEDKPFQCEHCEKSYKSKHTLTVHIKKNHLKIKLPRNVLICDYCQRPFNRRTNLVVHLRTHTGDRPYKCPYCPLSFTQWASIIRHKRTHTDERPYACLTCGKRYRCNNTLKIHITTHSNVRDYVCDVCKFAFKTKRTLKAHLLLHEADQKKFMCEMCGMHFNTNGNLQIHTRRRHSDKAGPCAVCKKMVSDVLKHEIQHYGMFKCSICNKSFNRPANLKTHIRHYHTEHAKFKCDVTACKAAFATKSKLDFHVMKFHTSETPFVCCECGRGFIRFCDLSKHLRVYHKYDSDKINVVLKPQEIKKEPGKIKVRNFSLIKEDVDESEPAKVEVS